MGERLLVGVWVCVSAVGLVLAFIALNWVVDRGASLMAAVFSWIGGLVGAGPGIGFILSSLTIATLLWSAAIWSKAKANVRECGADGA